MDNCKDVIAANFYLDLLKNISSAWKSHFWIYINVIKILKPKVIVELGTDRGFSLLAALFSLSKNNIDGIIYAIDAWGKNDEDKKIMITGKQRYITLKDKTLPLFIEKYNLDSCKQKLIREYFCDAKHNFSNIDILHIDGNHSYDECKRDYEEFKEKINMDEGVILFHDIARGKLGTKKEDFGVYKLFNEINHEKGYFLQHSGLGIVTDNENYLDQIESLSQELYSPVISKNKSKDKIELTDIWKKQHHFMRGNIPFDHLY